MTKLRLAAALTCALVVSPSFADDTVWLQPAMTNAAAELTPAASPNTAFWIPLERPATRQVATNARYSRLQAPLPPVVLADDLSQVDADSLSPSDVEVVEPAPVEDDHAGDSGCASCCDRGCSRSRTVACQPCAVCGCGSTCVCGLLDRLDMIDGCQCEPWQLFGTHRCSGFSAGGWLQFGTHSAGANGDGTGLFNNHPDTIDLQQMWFYIDKPANRNGCDWDWGFRMDYVYGTDGPDTQAFGGRPNDWDNNWDHGGYYGWAMPQLYVEFAKGNWLVRGGHFFTILGYEVVAAPDNFFYSHAHTMVRAEPFTHTGILFEYTHNDYITGYGGWMLGWDTGFSSNEGDIFLGAVNVAVTDNLSFTYGLTGGNFGYGNGGSDQNGYSHSMVFDWQVSDKFNYVVQSDYVTNHQFITPASAFNAGADWGNSWGINQYLLYQFNPCVGLGMRVEYFEQYSNLTNFSVAAVTLGANLRPTSNLIVRPEVRIDDYGTGTGRQDSTTVGLDAILTY